MRKIIIFPPQVSVGRASTYDQKYHERQVNMVSELFGLKTNSYYVANYDMALAVYYESLIDYIKSVDFDAQYLENTY